MKDCDNDGDESVIRLRGSRMQCASTQTRHKGAFGRVGVASWVSISQTTSPSPSGKGKKVELGQASSAQALKRLTPQALEELKRRKGVA